MVVANDGEEALRKLRGEGGEPPIRQPYLILLDLNMPGMDGLTFLDELRKSDGLKRSIVLVLTTSEDDRDKAAAFDRFIAGYISKVDIGVDFGRVLRLIDQMRTLIHFPPET